MDSEGAKSLSLDKVNLDRIGVAGCFEAPSRTGLPCVETGEPHPPSAHLFHHQPVTVLPSTSVDDPKTPALAGVTSSLAIPGTGGHTSALAMSQLGTVYATKRRRRNGKR